MTSRGQDSRRVSLPGVLLAMVLLPGLFLATGVISADRRASLQATFALGLNAGAVLALSLVLP